MKLQKFVVAVTDMYQMLTFYNTVFDSNLQQNGESPFYSGRLLDWELLFCPNSIAEVNAEKNRFQLTLVVDDIDAAIKQALDAGGSLYDDRTETDAQIACGIKDPDGNSFELVQIKTG